MTPYFETKSPAMVAMLDKTSQHMFGRLRSVALANSTCVACGESATLFTSEASEKEYWSSGMCEKCQDDIEREVGNLETARNNITETLTNLLKPLLGPSPTICDGCPKAPDCEFVGNPELEIQRWLAEDDEENGDG